MDSFEEIEANWLGSGLCQGVLIADIRHLSHVGSSQAIYLPQWLTKYGVDQNTEVRHKRLIVHEHCNQGSYGLACFS